jgi:hypothetical protein
MPKFRGVGGAIFDIDIPKEGSYRRELHDAQVACGDLVPVDEPAKKAPAVKKSTESEV